MTDSADGSKRGAGLGVTLAAVVATLEFVFILVLTGVLRLPLLGFVLLTLGFPVAATAWARLPRQRSLKLLLLGGPLAWIYAHDRERLNSFVLLLLGGPIVLLIRDL